MKAELQELNHRQGNKIICLWVAVTEGLEMFMHIDSELRKYSPCGCFKIVTDTVRCTVIS